MYPTVTCRESYKAKIFSLAAPLRCYGRSRIFIIVFLAITTSLRPLREILIRMCRMK